MNRPLDDNVAWYRQFWPWFLIALPATAVIASLVTLWIAIGARPDRIDGYGGIAVPVELSADRGTLRLDLGLPAESWPDSIDITVVSRSDGRVQRLLAVRRDARYFEAGIGPLLPGAYDVMLQTPGRALHGSWSYPAPVWKLNRDE